jgi:LemA protein
MMMLKSNHRSIFCAALVVTLIASQFVLANLTSSQGAPKPLTRDETYFAIARRNTEQSDSPVSNVVGVLDELIEIGTITPGADGKTTVVIKEKLPSSAAYTQKAIKLVFAPVGDKWRWESFEDRTKQYPVEKLFPYAKDEITKRKRAADEAWAKVLEAMYREGDTALKVLETAKAIIKADPTPLGPVTSARKNLPEAIKKAKEYNDSGVMRSAFQELNQAVEPVATLGDQHPDLKANDAWLRLQEEFIVVQKSLPVARKNYLEALAAYNEIVMRLPFGLVAYGLGYVKMESLIEAE